MRGRGDAGEGREERPGGIDCMLFIDQRDNCTCTYDGTGNVAIDRHQVHEKLVVFNCDGGLTHKTNDS